MILCTIHKEYQPETLAAAKNHFVLVAPSQNVDSTLLTSQQQEQQEEPWFDCWFVVCLVCA